MRGEPIPGEHWVEVDLQSLYSIDKILIDWEVAFSNKWTIKVPVQYEHCLQQLVCLHYAGIAASALPCCCLIS